MYQAISDPEKGTEVRDAKTGRLVWRMNGWLANIHVSNNGEYLVSEYGALLPIDFKPDFAVITVWKKGSKFQSLSVGDVLKHKKKLVRTVSHFHWGHIIGLDDDLIATIRFHDSSTLQFPLLQR